MKWFDVREKLPEFDNPVLVFRCSCESCTYPTGYLCMHGPETIRPCFDVATYNKKEVEVAEYHHKHGNNSYDHLYRDHWSISYVRAWAYLPKRPSLKKGIKQ